MIKKLPQILAFFFILITIVRVAVFMVYGLSIGFLGYFFAVGLAVGVFVSAYFIRPKQTRSAAIVSLVFFMGMDLWFNAWEVIRSLSTANLIAGNFIGMNDEMLQTGMQISGLVFAAFPTIAAGLLGWLQSGADKVTITRKKGFFGRIGVVIEAGFVNLFGESGAMVDGNALPSPANDSIDGTIVKWKKKDLRSDDWDWIATATTRAIASKYGQKIRTARNWKQEAISK